MFTSQREAQRHADAAAYVFRVFALPVYEGLGELPRPLRPPWRFADWEHFRPSDEVTLITEALVNGEVGVVESGKVVAIVDLDSPEPQEVRVLFIDASAADDYLQAAADWVEPTRAQTMCAYDSYDDCPLRERYTVSGPALSQHVRPR